MSFILIFLTILLAAIIQGFSGLGFAIVAAPILAQILETPSETVLLTIILANIIMTLVLIEELYKKNRPELKVIIPLFLATIIAIPLGTFLVKSFNVNYLKIIIGIIVAITAIFLYKGYTWKVKNDKLLTIGTGLISGLVFSSTGIIGPLTAIYAINQKWVKETYRINITVYFWSIQVVTISNYLIFGYRLAGINNFYYLIPAVIIGFYIGSKLVTKADTKVFANVILALVFILGFLSIVNGIRGLV